MTLTIFFPRVQGRGKGMIQAYHLHANSYLLKPVDFSQLIELMKTLGYFWLAWNAFPH